MDQVSVTADRHVNEHVAKEWQEPRSRLMLVERVSLRQISDVNTCEEEGESPRSRFARFTLTAMIYRKLFTFFANEEALQPAFAMAGSVNSTHSQKQEHSVSRRTKLSTLPALCELSVLARLPRYCVN